MQLAPPSADRIREKRAQDWYKTHPILLGQEKSLAKVLKHYIQGGGSQFDHVLRALRAKIDEIAAAQNFIQSNESVFDKYGRILPKWLRQFCPEYADEYFDVGPQVDIETHEIFSGGTNEYCDVSLPPPMNLVSHRPQRPALRAYAMRNAALFVGPAGYQLWNNDQNCFWPSASPRSFSKLVKSAPVLRIADHLVIIQDRYPGENFAHFLFDWIPRLGLFLESGLQPVKGCVFVMGGILDSFRTLLLRAASVVYGVDPKQFFFPEDPINLQTEGKIYWFSDQVDTYMHPAQIAHSRSIEVIKKISAAIEIAGGPFERIYISRSDTGRRRVANEHHIWQTLHDYDFEMIRLADHSVERQISLVRGAKYIVAPHGMGLTHLGFHRGRPNVLELFNRQRGGDDYAIISKAMGFDYQFIIGESVNNSFDDFAIPPDAVQAALEIFGLSPVTRAMSKVLHNLIPCSSCFGSKWHPGWQAEGARIANDVPAFLAGNAVVRHVRKNPDKQRDGNSGTWSDIPVECSRLYTASCWVWVPEQFAGEHIAISLGEWGHQDRVVANLSDRGDWQRIRATATAPIGVDRCNIVLRINGRDGAVVFSTCWQLEVGPVATEYRGTT